MEYKMLWKVMKFYKKFKKNVTRKNINRLLTAEVFKGKLILKHVNYVTDLEMVTV
jgi:hypothetical protein